MLSSLFSGTSGMKTNMNTMSVIGNNLSNMNTIGFKASRVAFADLMSQNISSLTGQNQVGLGVQMSDVSAVFTQGALETTSNTMDLAIEGDGMFIVKNEAGSDLYTRAGQFSFDNAGYMVDPGANIVRGFLADTNGNVGTALTDIKIDFSSVPPTSTTNIDMVANINSNSDITGYVFKTGVNDQVKFTIDPGGTPTTVTTSLITDDGLVSGEAYTGDEVAVAIRSALEAKDPSGGNYSVNYVKSTGLFTITNGATNTNSIRLDWDTSLGATALGFNATPSGIIAPGSSDVSDTMAGAFDVSKPIETSNFSSAINVFDSLGKSHQVSVYFRKSDTSGTGNTWQWKAVVDGTDSNSGNTEVQAEGTLKFTTAGALSSESTISYLLTSGGFDFSGGPTQGQSIAFDFGKAITEGSDGLGGLTQYGQASAVYSQHQDGSPVGTFQRSYVNKDGVLQGVYSNGDTKALAQLGLAKFTNNQGLIKEGGNLFAETADSGSPVVTVPGTGSVGSIHSSSLELSTVDIAEEFVKMITAQRGFQASSRIITTTDELLTELVNLKR